GARPDQRAPAPAPAADPPGVRGPAGPAGGLARGARGDRAVPAPTRDPGPDARARAGRDDRPAARPADAGALPGSGPVPRPGLRSRARPRRGRSGDPGPAASAPARPTARLVRRAAGRS